ncbi:MAG: zinc-ribbon domain-containing protein [Spirochaetaceae bacterium]|jgi:hypothetical protein|nr:zinc-ribbon domain-containing protein [Spirochaetaceae bacterium]
MKIFCPKCNTQITDNRINIQENICTCANCNEVFYISEILDQGDIKKAEEMLFYPPKGIKIKKCIEKMIVQISTFSKNGFVLIPFSILFSGISFFGFFGTIFIKANIIFTIFWLVFVIPSVLIAWKAIYAIFGKIEFVFNENGIIYVFIGVGRIGKKYYINWGSIKKIFELKSHDSDGQLKREIYIEEEKTIKIPLENINELKAKFILLILKYYKYKTIKEIVK